MARKVNQARWDAWRQRIEKQRRSGRSIAEFCRSEGISQASFHTWKRKLRIGSTKDQPRAPGQQASQTPPGRVRGVPRHATCGDSPLPSPSSGGACFVELPVRTAPASPWMELALADGTIVRLPQQNTAALIAVLRFLRGEPLDSFRAEACHA